MGFEDVAMTKEEIERICSDEYVRNIKDRYTGYSEMYYSNGKLIKQKYFYPQFLDLYVTVEHGIHEESSADAILPDILQDTQVFLFCRKVKSRYKKVLTSGNMFVYYKEKNKIKPKESRVGTVVFPPHSHPGINWDVNWQEYIDKLKQLPQEMFPLLICLYYHDVQKGAHNIFYENGFDVTTAGHRKDPKFIERFYEILSNVKYSTSNMIMSSTFYAVDFGIPFYFYGADRGIKGIGSPIQHSKFEQNSSERFREIQNHFVEFKNEVSEEDKKIIYKYLGEKDDEDKRWYITYILYREFVRYQSIFLKRNIYKSYLKLMYKKYISKNSLNIFNHMELEERLLLIKYARKVKRGKIVEIGSFLGSNTINLAKNASNSVIFAIDNWSRHQVDNCKDIFEDNISDFKNVVVLDGEFKKTYEKFNEKIDMLVIDGEHNSYEVVKRDLHLFDNLKKGGVIIIHHYKWSPFVKMNIIDHLQSKTKEIILLENIWVGKKNV